MVRCTRSTSKTYVKLDLPFACTRGGMELQLDKGSLDNDKCWRPRSRKTARMPKDSPLARRKPATLPLPIQDRKIDMSGLPLFAALIKRRRQSPNTQAIRFREQQRIIQRIVRKQGRKIRRKKRHGAEERDEIDVRVDEARFQQHQQHLDVSGGDFP